MHTNLAHDVFIQKGKSIALASQVEEFLLAQGKSEPTQIPFGKSLYIEQCLKSGKDPYAFSLKTLMTQSVEKAQSEKSIVKKLTIELSEPDYTPDLSSDRKAKNREARTLAWATGAVKFYGSCKYHGTQIFNMRKQGKDHICNVCQCIKLKAYREKLKRFNLLQKELAHE